MARITKLQRRACKIILGNEYHDFKTAKSSLNMLSFEQSVFLNKAKIMFKVANSLVPQYICDLFQRRSEIAPHTSFRSITNQNFAIPKPNLTLSKDSISYSGAVVWNSIPKEIKEFSELLFILRKCCNMANKLLVQVYESIKLTVNFCTNYLWTEVCLHHMDINVTS